MCRGSTTIPRKSTVFVAPSWMAARNGRSTAKGARHARHANTCARGRGGFCAFLVDFDKRLLLDLTDVQAIATEPRGVHHAAQIRASCVECLSHANRLERFI